MQYYANFIDDRSYSIKKATLYAKEFHTSKVILTFSFYLLYFIAGRKKNLSLRLQFAAEFVWLFITIQQLFTFVNILVSFWRMKNNNESTKRVILQPSQQISKKFLNYCVNAFTAKKIHVKPSAICWQKQTDAFARQENLQENSV